MPHLSATNLTIGYLPPRRDRIVVAAELNVDLKSGELVCLLGPNGVGKSTLMRTLAGMQKPLNGAVTIDDLDVHGMTPEDRARRIGIVLTDRIDVGHLTVRTLVALGRYPHTNWMGNLTQEDEQAVDIALRAVDAMVLADRSATELSDGERQKVMIARALAQDTDAILLDEPTAFLDLPRRVETMDLLRGLAAETGKAILLSTHDLDLAIRNADRLWLMAEGEIHTGIPEVLILDGRFAVTFGRGGIRFDLETGGFRVGTGNGERIAVLGNGAAAVWTARALERIGYSVVTQDAERSVVVGDEIPVRWDLRHHQDSRGFDDLESLIDALRLRQDPLS